ATRNPLYVYHVDSLKFSLALSHTLGLYSNHTLEIQYKHSGCIISLVRMLTSKSFPHLSYY
ncbi:MAG TPA: hypothetical protein VGO47_08220, partial [Chlamydiales bacterium]|nr:hypothetical protein [Chlamydiales bacterium]